MPCPAGVLSTNARNVTFDGSDDQSVDAAGRFSEPRGLITPESLAEVITHTRQLLTEQAAGCLMVCSNFESHVAVAERNQRQILVTRLGKYESCYCFLDVSKTTHQIVPYQYYTLLNLQPVIMLWYLLLFCLLFWVQ